MKHYAKIYKTVFDALLCCVGGLNYQNRVRFADHVLFCCPSLSFA